MAPVPQVSGPLTIQTPIGKESETRASLRRVSTLYPELFLANRVRDTFTSYAEESLNAARPCKVRDRPPSWTDWKSRHPPNV